MPLAQATQPISLNSATLNKMLAGAITVGIGMLIKDWTNYKAAPPGSKYDFELAAQHLVVGLVGGALAGAGIQIGVS
jgi:hypothetical protein